MQLVATKAVTAGLAAVVTFGLGIAPWKIGKYVDPENEKHQIATSLLLCFGGGVLLATSLAHMAPEFIEMCDKGFPNALLPVGLIFMSCGFLFIYFIEESVQLFCFKQKTEKEGVRLKSIKTFGGNHTVGVATNQQQEPSNIQSDNGVGDECWTVCDDTKTGEYKNVINCTADDQEACSSPTGSIKTVSSTIRDMLTIIALSFHSVFEGMAIGLEGSTTKVWILYAAITVHKSVIAFCVGLELFTKPQNSKKMNLFYMGTFAMMSPIGICLGMGIMSVFDENSPNYNAVVGLCQALAGGTLLYVVVFEILDREKAKKDINGLLQLLFIVLGYGMILLIEYEVKSHGIDT